MNIRRQNGEIYNLLEERERKKGKKDRREGWRRKKDRKGEIKNRQVEEKVRRKAINSLK
jgi:hypothetical protein